MKTISLTAGERITLMNILPIKSDIDRMKVICQLKNFIGFDEQETVDLDIRLPGDIYIDRQGKEQIVQEGKIIWDDENEKQRLFEFNDTVLNIIENVLSHLNESSEITEEIVPLYEKFME